MDMGVADDGVGHAGVGSIWKGWIVGIAVRRGAVAQRLGEIRLAPGADASLGIGRDVRRVEGAEGGGQRPPAGQRRAAALLVGVAAEAAGGLENIAAALDLTDRKSTRLNSSH